MPKLILSVDGQVLKEYQLSKERTLIGRKPHNDIQIDNLAVSGEHAAIITILNDSFIEDLGSTNGTMVNGKPVKKHFLQNNDVVEIGKHKLKYFNDAPTAATAADFEKTMIIRYPAKAAPPPPPPVAEKGLGDTQTNLKPMTAETTKPPVSATTTATQAPTAAPAAPAPAPCGSAASAPACPRSCASGGSSAGCSGGCREHVARGRDPGAFRRRRGSHARSHEEPHPRSASRDAGCSHHQAPERLLHHPRGGRHLSDVEWRVARRPGAPAWRS